MFEMLKSMKNCHKQRLQSPDIQVYNRNTNTITFLILKTNIVQD